LSLLQQKKNRVPQVTLLPCPPSASNHANPLLSNQTPRLLAPPELWSDWRVTCIDLALVAVLPSPLRSIPSSLRSVIPTTASSPFLQNLYQHHQIIIQEMSSRGGKLAPEVNRALFVKNLSYNVTPEELFDLFGKFGPIRQVRQGIANNTKGTAFVVYEDVTDAKQACDKLNGFNFQNRYLVVLYHQPDKMAKSKEDLEARRESLAQLKKQHGID
jgi:pre-mRNA branch site protein p14